MTPEEYAVSQADISAAVYAYVQRFANLFTGPALSTSSWVELLRVLFPEVQKRYTESAELARRFYDSQREQHYPGLPRNDRLLTELKPEWFAENLNPSRKAMSQADSSKKDVAQLDLRSVREVEMAGRRQILGAVKNDPETRIVQGWARVATGRETCAWCLMLISRGAVYKSAQSAGLDSDDESVIAGYDDAEMEEWHVGCDCKVVPVFSVEEWPGKAESDRAKQLWIDATKEARQRIESGEARSNNLNNETLNALRRKLSRGDRSMKEFAALAA